MVRDYLDASDSFATSVIIDEYTDDEDLGCVFYYQSADYVRTGEDKYSLVGNAPLVSVRSSSLAASM